MITGEGNIAEERRLGENPTDLLVDPHRISQRHSGRLENFSFPFLSLLKQGIKVRPEVTWSRSHGQWES